MVAAGWHAQSAAMGVVGLGNQDALKVMTARVVPSHLIKPRPSQAQGVPPAALEFHQDFADSPRILGYNARAIWTTTY